MFVNIKEFIENTSGEFERDLGMLIAIESVAGDAEGNYPYGSGSAHALDAMLSLAEGYGFVTENHDYHCGSVIYGDNEKEVGIVAHLDVVPAGNGWSTESPFKLEKRDNCYIGRGVRDDKGPALMGLYAMRYFKENHIRLPFAIRLILGCDEEVGSSDLEYFKKVRKAPWFSFTPDSTFPVCIGEKGIMSFTVCLGDADPSIAELHGGSVSNAVPGEAYIRIAGSPCICPKKDRITVKECENATVISAVGVTAHASTPEHGVNAVYLLADYLLQNNLVPQQNRAAFEFIRASESEYLGKTFGIDFADEYFGYLTCVGGVMELADGKIYMQYNVRFPMSRTFDMVFDGVLRTVAERGFTVTNSNRGSAHANGYFKSPDSSEIKALLNAIETVTGSEQKPYTMGGGTYARGLENTVVFGPSQKRYSGLLGEGKGDCHDVDEYLAAEEITEGIEAFIRALQGLSEI